MGKISIIDKLLIGASYLLSCLMLGFRSKEIVIALIIVMILLCIRLYIACRKNNITYNYLKTRRFKKNSIKVTLFILLLTMIPIILTEIQTKFNEKLMTALLFCISICIGSLFTGLILNMRTKEKM